MLCTFCVFMKQSWCKDTTKKQEAQEFAPLRPN